MSSNTFMAECAKRTIDPAVALENEKVKAALKARDDKEVLRLLDTEF